VLLLVGIFGKTPDPGASLPDGPSTSAARQTSTTSLPPGSTSPTATTPPPVATTTTTVPPPPPPGSIPDTTVVVLNSTDTSGLASRVTEYLDGLGWQVEAPDNFLTTLEETTVYYPEGEEAAARQLAAAAPGDADTVSPAVPEVASDVLTVVLGNDAVDWVAPGEQPSPTTT
jgi:hypothetical protein